MRDCSLIALSLADAACLIPHARERDDTAIANFINSLVNIIDSINMSLEAHSHK